MVLFFNKINRLFREIRYNYIPFFYNIIQDSMNILYYSNYCKHSQKILQFFVKNNLTEQVNFICIDKRKQDPNTGQMNILLENGSQILLPPNVHSVPSLLLVKESYSVIIGDAIMAKYQSTLQTQTNNATDGNGEPMGVSLNSVSIGTVISEQYTSYNASPQDLSSKSNSTNNRPLYNYVSANENGITIQTPPDTYRPDKVSQNVTIDTLQQKRNEDVNVNKPPPFMPPTI